MDQAVDLHHGHDQGIADEKLMLFADPYRVANQRLRYRNDMKTSGDTEAMTWSNRTSLRISSWCLRNRAAMPALGQPVALIASMVIDEPRRPRRGPMRSPPAVVAQAAGPTWYRPGRTWCQR